MSTLEHLYVLQSKYVVPEHTSDYMEILQITMTYSRVHANTSDMLPYLQMLASVFEYLHVLRSTFKYSGVHANTPD
jgi:hypothetical protein